MSLPPEHIRIKRRREEEPVETLYIQSESVQRSKRRFTDFIFQRVVKAKDQPVTVPGSPGAGDAAVSGSGSGAPVSAQKPGLSPAPGHGHGQAHQRAVSVGGLASRSGSVPDFGADDGPKVPRVRATKPGEEFESPKRRGKQDAAGGGLKLGPGPGTRTVPPASGANVTVPAGSGSAASRMRRFHLAASQSQAGDEKAMAEYTDRLLHKASGGVQKRKTNRGPSRAVVVEKTAELAEKAERLGVDDLSSMIGDVKVSTAEEPSRMASTSPRKKRVVNEAEKRWRSEEKASRYADRTLHDRDRVNKVNKGQSATDDPTTWNQESEQLADELEQIAMQMTGDLPSPASATPAPAPAPAPPAQPPKSVSKPALKYQPRLPKHLRAGGRSRDGKSTKGGMQFDGGSDEMEEEGENMDVDTALPAKPQSEASDPTVVVGIDDDSDSGYVYDEFIRRPVHEIKSDSGLGYMRNGEWVGAGEDVEAPRNVGVVVITNADVHFWDALAEDDDDDKGWDSEDEDSNAEDNPANEYPDEDLDFDDEFGGSGAAYRQYRHYASDDEEFDANEYDEYDGYGAPVYSDDERLDY